MLDDSGNASNGGSSDVATTTDIAGANQTFADFLNKDSSPLPQSSSGVKEKETKKEEAVLLETVVGTSVEKTWFGVTRQCNDAEKVGMLRDELVSGDPQVSLRMVKVTKHLLNTKNAHYRALSKAASRVRSWWRDQTTPWVKDGVRILKKANYAAFVSGYEERYKEFTGARAAFLDAWPEVVADAKAHLKGLFDAGAYPADLPAATFEFSLDFPGLVGDASVAGLDPQAYDRMKKVAEARLDQACAVAEKAFAAHLQELVARLAGALTPGVGPDGRPLVKRLGEGTLSAFKEFYADFKKLKVGDHHELDVLFQRAVALAEGADVKALKTCGDQAEALKGELKALADTIHVVTGAAPCRKIGSKKKKQTSTSGAEGEA